MDVKMPFALSEIPVIVIGIKSAVGVLTFLRIYGKVC